MHRISTFTQLFGFVLLAIFVNIIPIKILIFMAYMFISFNVLFRASAFLNTLKRFRWLLLVLVIVYALSTPGEHIGISIFGLSPTYEGISTGGTQVLRIVLMLSVISLIWHMNTREQLLGGFYCLLFPLKYLGFHVNKFVARLWLTLFYVEAEPVSVKNKDFFQHLRDMAAVDERKDASQSVIICIPDFTWVDYVLIAVSLLLLSFGIMKVWS